MSDLAIIEQPASIKPQKIDKPIRIPARVRHGCELIASGECKTITAAAERVKLSREHLSKMMARPHIQAFIARKASENIHRGTLRASTRLVELIDAESEHVSANVSMRLLEEGGILQRQQGHSTSVSIVNNVSPGYVVDLTPSAPDMSHNPTIEGKALTHKGDVSDER